MKSIWFNNLKELNLKKINIKERTFAKKYSHNKQLNIRGVGFKVWSYKKNLNFDLGLTHYVSFRIPETVNTITKKTKIVVSSNHKQKLGNIASSLKNLKYPDSYKGKGIRFLEDNIKLKVGKVKN